MQVTVTSLFQFFLAAQFSIYVVLSFRSKRLLPFSLLLATLCTHMALNFLIAVGFLEGQFDITFAFRFLYGPLLYLTVREIIKNVPELKTGDLYHALPFVIALPTASYHAVFDVLGIISLGAYFICTIRLMHRVKNLSADMVSTPGAGRIDWVETTAIGMILISIFDITHLMMGKYFDVLVNPVFSQLTLVLLLLLLNWFAYKTLLYPDEFEGFTHDDIVQIQHPQMAINDQSEGTDALSDEDVSQIEYAITVLKERDMYLDPNLRASDLADCVNLKQRFISRALYLYTGMRFNSFVNSLRIERAKQLISQTPNEKINLLAISFEAGFNSKTAFNTSFKTFTGMTPSEYRNSKK